MEALPRWPFIAHSCANLHWQTLPITPFHNLQHSLKNIEVTLFHIFQSTKLHCKKERLHFVTTNITWRRKLKKTELTSKKEDEEMLFLNFSAQYVFCNIFYARQIFFSWKRTFPVTIRISREKEPFHYQVRLADGSRVVVKLNTFHTVPNWKLLYNFDPTRMMFAWFAKWKKVIFASQ